MVIIEFISWALRVECVFKKTNADLMQNFQAAMRTHSGEDWLDTWCSSVDFPERQQLCLRNVWVRGTLKPLSFVEFAMQVELFTFVKGEVENQLTENPESPRSPRLLYYTIIGNALLFSMNSFVAPSQESWQDFARFLLRNGFHANEMVEINISSDRGNLMAACLRNEPVFETVQGENTGEIDQGQDYRGTKADGTECSDKDSHLQSSDDHEQGSQHNAHGSEHHNGQIDNDGNDIGDNRIRHISIFHLALAIACTNNDEGYRMVGRFDMLRLLVEHGGNTSTSYQNYWSPRSGVAAERSAMHYLLSLEFEDKDGVDGVLDAFDECITAFLNHGADPNAVDSKGISILELAVSSCPYALVELMLQKGAKVTPRLLLPSGAPDWTPTAF
jgi:hypothetical protein